MRRVENTMSVISWQALTLFVGRWTAYAVRVVMRQTLVFCLNPKAHRFSNASQLPCIMAEKDPRDPYALTPSYLICLKSHKVSNETKVNSRPNDWTLETYPPASALKISSACHTAPRATLMKSWKDRGLLLCNERSSYWLKLLFEPLVPRPKAWMRAHTAIGHA